VGAKEHQSYAIWAFLKEEKRGKREKNHQKKRSYGKPACSFSRGVVKRESGLPQQKINTQLRILTKSLSPKIQYDKKGE